MDKKELMKILKEEKEVLPDEEKYEESVIILELKKITDELGIIKGEYYSNDVLEYRGSLIIPLSSQKTTEKVEKVASEWDKMDIGKSRFYVLSLDSRGKTLSQKLIGWIERSIEEGKIQDFIPLKP